MTKLIIIIILILLLGVLEYIQANKDRRERQKKIEE